jgi:hypothetical protein
MGFGSRIRDPGSGKRPIPDPGSRGQKGTGSGSATLIAVLDFWLWRRMTGWQCYRTAVLYQAVGDCGVGLQ